MKKENESRRRFLKGAAAGASAGAAAAFVPAANPQPERAAPAATEPLPAGHPLWKAPNLIITPHYAAWSDIGRERRWLLYRENLRRFVAGEPLLSVVDPERGY